MKTLTKNERINVFKNLDIQNNEITTAEIVATAQLLFPNHNPLTIEKHVCVSLVEDGLLIRVRQGVYKIPADGETSIARAPRSESISPRKMSDAELAEELRKRGYEVNATKKIEL